MKYKYKEAKNLTYNLWTKKYQVPQGDTAPPKMSKKLSPWKIDHFKILNAPLKSEGVHSLVTTVFN